MEENNINVNNSGNRMEMDRRNNNNGKGRKGRGSEGKHFWIKGHDVRADECLVRQLCDVRVPVDGIELHDVYGFVRETIFLFREKMLNGWDMVGDVVRLAKVRDGIFAICYHLVVGCTMYLYASASSTMTNWTQQARRLYDGNDIYVDEDMFNLLNAFMPLHKCVQVNSFDVMYRLMKCYDLLINMDVMTQSEGSEVSNEIFQKAVQCAINNGDTNPIWLVVKDVLEHTTCMCESKDEMDQIVKIYPYFKYNIADVTFDKDSSLVFSWITVKTFNFAKDYKKYYWKLRRLEVATMVRDGRMYANTKLNEGDIRLLGKVSPTYDYRLPVHEVTVKTQVVRDLYSEEYYVNEIEMVGVEDVLKNITSFDLTGSNIDLAGMRDIQKQVSDVMNRKQMKSVANPRKSETLRKLETKEKKIGGNFSAMSAKKIVEKQGIKVKVDYGWYVWVTGFRTISKRRMDVVRAYAKARNIKDGAEFKVDQADQALFDQFVGNTAVIRFD